MSRTQAFKPNIWIKDFDNSTRSIESVDEAVAYLRVFPTLGRGEGFRAAAVVVLAAAKGERTIEEARLAFRRFAADADILAEADPP